MKKKLLVIVGIAVVVFAVLGAASVVRNRNAEQEIEGIIREGNEERDAQASSTEAKDGSSMVSLEDARSALTSMVEKGKNGEYRNLEFSEFTPFMTEEDTVCALRTFVPEMEYTAEGIPDVVALIQSFFPGKIDEGKIRIDNFEGLTLDELRGELESGNPDYTEGGYYMLYINGEEYAQVNSCMTSLWIDRGLEGAAPSGDDLLDRVYYAGAADGSLDEAYETSTGSLSVGEAIAQTEAFFNEGFPVPLGDGMEYRAARVYILEMPDGTYAFDLSMRRSYRGVAFESANSGTFAYGGDDTADLSEALLDGENHVLFFNGIDCNRTVEVTDAYSEILSPERAAEYLSQKIGDNTVYTVTGVELSYRIKDVGEAGGVEDEETPVWTFLTVNQTSGQETRFYVDVVTGQVDTRVM